jgi:spermidine synthase
LPGKIDRKIRNLIITTGISSVVTQLLTIREFLSLFNGNEFVIALLLFNWLVLGGAGTLLANIVRSKANVRGLYWISILLALLSPLQLIVIRSLRDFVFIYGSSVGFYPTLFYSFFTIAPYTLLLGFALPFSLIVLRGLIQDFPGTKIYIFDNIGDVLGGAVFSFILVYLLTPFQAVAIAAVPLFYTANVLFIYFYKNYQIPIVGTLVGLAFLSFFVLIEAKTLEKPDSQLVFYDETPYGRIQIYKQDEQYTLFQNGRPVFSNLNLIEAEEAVHYPLSQVNAVNDILFISTAGQMMTEIEKYYPKSVDYVEIDPVISETILQYDMLKKIPAMNIIHQDGREFLQKTKKRYDAILLNLPEPDTFQINRFYTDDFFKLASKRLAPGGVFSFSLTGFDSYISDNELQKVSTLHQTARTAFPHVYMIPGGRIYFLCSDKPFAEDIPALLEKKSIITTYISGFYYGDITQTKINYLKNLLIDDIKINKDFVPRIITKMQTEWFSKFAASPTAFILIIMIQNIFYLLNSKKEDFVLYTSGCFVMGSEILVIFAFQILFGYIYLQIGLIVTVFLAGMLPGAVLGEAVRKYGKQLLVIADVVMIFLLSVFVAALTLSGALLNKYIFLIFGFFLSVSCGFQFPVAISLQKDKKPAVIRAFSADLVGAAFGTILTSTLLIPYTGILWTGIILIFLKIFSLIVISSNNENAIPKKISLF